MKYPWTYRDAAITKPISEDEYYGFVYCITNKTNGRKYIGKKFFWSKRTQQKNGKKRKFLAESDWQDYWGSNNELLADIELLGHDCFSRIILHLCKSKGECSYLEAKEQFAVDALLTKEYYNSWISVKVTKKHLVKYADRLRKENGVQLVEKVV